MARVLLGTDEYEIEGRLGTGSYGEVFKARSIKDGESFAIKRSRRKARSSLDRKEVEGELQVLAEIGVSPFCVKYYDAWEHEELLCTRFELCDRGTLQDFLASRELREDTIWALLADMTLGIQHIHKKNILHLDLKPANIFIAASGKLKIGDFGIAIKDKPKTRLDRDGDPIYLAPEALDKSLGPLSFPADIFSLGVILLEMAADVRLPPNGTEWHKLRNNDLSCLNSSDRSTELKELVKKCMQRHPLQRPTTDSLVSDGAGADSLIRAIQTTLKTDTRADVRLPPMKPVPLLNKVEDYRRTGNASHIPRRHSMPAGKATSMELSPAVEVPNLENKDMQAAEPPPRNLFAEFSEARAS